MLAPEILTKIKELPEEMELTEHEWYEFHYYLRQNLFIISEIRNLGIDGGHISVIEPFETYIGSILEALGYRVSVQHLYGNSQNASSAAGPSTKLASPALKFDALLLVKTLESQPDHPEDYLQRLADTLVAGAPVLIVSENIAQFKNRLKLLFGHSIFSYLETVDRYNYREFGIRDLVHILNRVGLSVETSRFLSPYPAHRMEPLSLKRFLIKKAVRLAMKTRPSLGNLIYIKARKREPEEP